MHKLLCSRCLHRVNVVLPSISSGRPLPCSHVRRYSRWFALYEDVNPVEIPISELPSSSSYTHGAPIGLNDPRPLRLRRSLSTASFVPTSVDHSELGGRDTVDEEAIANVLGTSTGSPSTSMYDLDSLLGTIEESNLELPKLDYSRDLLPASSLRGSAPSLSPLKKLSRSSPEKEKVERLFSRGRGVRSRLSSVSAASAVVATASIAAAPMVAAVATPVVAARSPAAVAAASTGEAVKEMETTQPEEFVPSPIRDGEMNVRELMETVRSSGMAGLRSMLAESHWPSARLTPYQVSDVFTLIVEQAKDCEECREMMRDFACASPRHFLPSHILLLLASRAAREEGVQRALETLQFHRKAFMLAPASIPKHASLRTEATRSLWKEVAKREKKADSREVLDAAIDAGLVDGPKEYVEETLRERMRNGTSFSLVYRQWRELGNRYGSVHHGMDTVVRMAMRAENGEERVARLKTISSYVSSSPSLRIEAFIVHLIVNLLEQGEEAAAKHVFSLVAIHGKHWRKILGEMDREETPASLVLVERIADLITYGTIGEIVKGPKKRKSKKEAVVEVSAEAVKAAEERVKKEKDPLSEQMEKIVWRANGGKVQQKKNGYKKQLRRVKVDQKEVHQLAQRIQETWIRLETAINGHSSEGMKKLVLWSMLHRLSIPSRLSQFVPSEKNPPAKRESGV
ncbi:hypothetical protein PFISCL1PPCAC_2267 [Pristionchus fissidentatus]|uniref:Pentatricopeptide repeat-containing protein n=1 Tax=Pristionchus fissidentatus TaxID=1538716 RepID=A0AAV5UUK0_9BILA|nr:hypothetical protein PFISCL1PPCAC_2267 [Pristionchus fissidentatus]